MRGDGAAAEVAGDRYEAIIWKLNGGTNFGCMADDEAAGRVIERHCAAVPGDVPLWGQRGQFLAVAGDVRALVEYEAGYGGPLNAHFQFHAVDLDRPFISATGYRSHFDTARGCMTVASITGRALMADASWLHVKLLLVLALCAVHGMLVKRIKDLRRGANVAPAQSANYLVFALLLPAVVIGLAVFKPSF